MNIVEGHNALSMRKEKRWRERCSYVRGPDVISIERVIRHAELFRIESELHLYDLLHRVVTFSDS